MKTYPTKIQVMERAEYAAMPEQEQIRWIDSQIEFLDADRENVVLTASQNLMTAARHHFETGEHDEAANILLDAVHTESNFAFRTGLYARACEYARLTGRYNDALKAANIGINDCPTSAKIKLEKMETLAALEKFDSVTNMIENQFRKRDFERSAELALFVAQHMCNHDEANGALEILRPHLISIVQGNTRVKKPKEIAAIGIALSRETQEASVLRKAYIEHFGNIETSNTPRPNARLLETNIWNDPAPEMTA